MPHLNEKAFGHRMGVRRLFRFGGGQQSGLEL